MTVASRLAVALAVAETREEERRVARETREAQLDAAKATFDADIKAAKAAAEKKLAETIATERQQALERQVQAVDSAVAATIAKERSRTNMLAVVRARPCDCPLAFAADAALRRHTLAQRSVPRPPESQRGRSSVRVGAHAP